MHARSKFYSGVTFVTLVAVLTYDIVDDISFVAHFEFYLGFLISRLIVLVSFWATVMPCGSNIFAVKSETLLM